MIYCDDELKSAHFVFECKKGDVSDAEFEQSIEQAVGNRNLLGASYCGAVPGLTRRLLRFDGLPPGERDRNHLTDIPVRYGSPPEWRFYKNRAGQDLAAVPREGLQAAIRKCHQTLCEGGRRSPIAAFGEFYKLVFIKHRDEKDLNRVNEQPYAFQRRDGETPDGLAKRINNFMTMRSGLSRTCLPTASTWSRRYWRSAWNTWRTSRWTVPNGYQRSGL